MPHTPGPWIVTIRDCGDNIFSCKRRIANVYGDMDIDENKSNANLIAAAPELLAACLSALENLGEIHGHEEQWACEELRNAIAKAEGRS